MLHDELSRLATGRSVSLFLEDWNRHVPDIEREIRGRRILVIGGAGSIGSSTVKLLSEFQPQTLHVVDQNENGLAELVRDLRSRSSGLRVEDFRTLPIDFGSPLMRQFVGSERPYDMILNFAALKHVRSEKDTFSLLQMINTNLVKPWRCCQWLFEQGSMGRYFSVSTDKAANPVNLMGATKRAMEHLIFSSAGALGEQTMVTSSRFANVAFSDGSLLSSFVRRLDQRQPLACPRNTRRFFISLPESGQICLLAAVCADDRQIVIPRLNPNDHLRKLDELAGDFLRHMGFEPRYCTNEEDARSSLESDLRSRRYPLLLTPLDTAGEKAYEEFVGADEATVEIGMDSLLAVKYRPMAQPEILPEVLSQLECFINSPVARVDKSCVIGTLHRLAAELQHEDQPRTLDERM